jgi:hypothetical protein
MGSGDHLAMEGTMESHVSTDYLAMALGEDAELFGIGEEETEGELRALYPRCRTSVLERSRRPTQSWIPGIVLGEVAE